MRSKSFTWSAPKQITTLIVKTGYFTPSQVRFYNLVQPAPYPLKICLFFFPKTLTKTYFSHFCNRNRTIITNDDEEIYWHMIVTNFAFPKTTSAPISFVDRISMTYKLFDICIISMFEILYFFNFNILHIVKG